MGVDISVVIPLYNGEQYIKDCLNSILNQTQMQWECIVVNDKSTDNGAVIVQQLAQQHQNIIFLQQDENKKGACAARNKGLMAATGKYVIFLDSDDLMHQEISAHASAYLTAKNTDYQGFVFNCKLFNTTPGDTNLLWNYVVKQESAVDRFLMGDTPWGTSSGIWNTKFLLENKLFWNEQLSNWQDWHWHIQLLITAKPAILFLPQYTIYNYRLNQAGMSSKSNEYSYKKHVLRALHAVSNMPLTASEQQQVAKAMFRFAVYPIVKKGSAAAFKETMQTLQQWPFKIEFSSTNAHILYYGYKLNITRLNLLLKKLWPYQVNNNYYTLWKAIDER